MPGLAKKFPRCHFLRQAGRQSATCVSCVRVFFSESEKVRERRCARACGDRQAAERGTGSPDVEGRVSFLLGGLRDGERARREREAVAAGPGGFLPAALGAGDAVAVGGAARQRC